MCKMRTSPSQFEMLVNFMELHGDLNKPCKTTKARMETMRNWERLKNLLNSDRSGEPKNIEKWKKVWSDFKNNTKRKAAKIHGVARGTISGSLTPGYQLSDLEQRVLIILDPQTASSLLEEIKEAEVSQIRVCSPVPDKRETCQDSINNDFEWRNFLKQKHEDEMRIRERELDIEKRWQDVALLAVDALHKIIDSKLCRDE